MAVGKIGPFDLHKDDWNLYVERIEQFFIVNEVKVNIQVATLITVIGSEAYELMVNLCTPVRPATKTFAELVSVMRNHLQPKPSLLAERFKFRQRRQLGNESIKDYVAELKKLTKDCDFSAGSLAENLRDQFVCGIASDNIRQRLFTEENIPFERAVRLAVSMEAAETDAALVDGRKATSSSSAEVYQLTPAHYREEKGDQFERQGQKVKDKQLVRGSKGGNARGWTASANRGRDGSGNGGGGGNYRYRQEPNASERNSGECRVCGRNHEQATCKFKMYVCRVCNKEGHLKRMCPKLKGASASAVYNNRIEEITYSSESDESDEVMTNHHNLIDIDFSQYPPIMVDVQVNKITLKMEVDSGSAMSCISEECYNRLFTKYTLLKSQIRLHYYTGEIVEPIGKIYPVVCYGKVCKKLELYVIKGGKSNLLGRYWMYELGIQAGPRIACNRLDVRQHTFNLNVFSSRFCKVFEDGLGRFTGGTVGFNLRPDARPVFMRARPLAYALREPVEKALDQLVKDGVITPVNSSDWATPIVPIMKKDGTIRVCGDFKITLNKCLEVDRFPLPKVEDLLAKLYGGEKFTKLDLSQAYAQLELDESKKYTVINTHKGLFRYNRLIYGLASSPGIFQRKLEQLFADMSKVGVFLDDVIITGRDDKEHLTTLYEVFERLQKYGLKIKKEKCIFFAESVTYLGFTISKDGVHTCPDKIEAIKNAPIPQNVSELRSFLGLVMYYAKFVPNISTILAPLYILLRKDIKFKWDDACERAFIKVKKILISSEILAHYSPELPLVLTTDASSVGIGAVISHLMPETEVGGQERPIAYASRILNKAERGYSQIEKEALAIIYGVRKFHQYLFGRKFILRTDHKPLVSIFGDKYGIPVMAASRMQRWAVLLSGYDYQIEYVRSDKNAADALSRLPTGRGRVERREKTYVHFIQKFLPITRKTVKENLAKDEVLKKVVFYLQSGWPAHCSEDSLKPYFARRNEMYLDRDCVVWGYRMVIPSSLRGHVLNELHVGHMGIVKMKCMARSYVWWPGIDADIERTGQECVTCAAEATAPPRAPPQPWPFPAEPWTRLHIDFLGPFHGRSFLVLIDATSKWIEAFHMTKTTAIEVIRVLRETFARFGLPKEVVSDNGPPFSSREYEEFMRNNGVKVTHSAVYHPASNGAAEGAVKLCKRAVKKALRDGYDIDTALQSYLMMYRNVEHSTTGVSPAVALQRRKLNTRLDLLRNDREVIERVLKEQQRQVSYAGGVNRNLEVGDTVWARDFTTGRNWQRGKINQRVGRRNYLISRENGPLIKRHIDQIKTNRNFVWHTTYPGTSTLTGSGGPELTAPEARVIIGSGETGTQQGHGLERVEQPREQSVLEPINLQAAAVNHSKRVRQPVIRYGFEFD